MYVVTNISEACSASICRSGNTSPTHYQKAELHNPNFHHCDNPKFQSVPHFLVLTNFLSLRKTSNWSQIFVFQKLDFKIKMPLQMLQGCTFHSCKVSVHVFWNACFLVHSLAFLMYSGLLKRYSSACKQAQKSQTGLKFNNSTTYSKHLSLKPPPVTYKKLHNTNTYLQNWFQFLNVCKNYKTLGITCRNKLTGLSSIKFGTGLFAFQTA